jgi:hypothetical protein
VASIGNSTSSSVKSIGRKGSERRHREKEQPELNYIFLRSQQLSEANET